MKRPKGFWIETAGRHSKVDKRWRNLENIKWTMGEEREEPVRRLDKTCSCNFFLILKTCSCNPVK
jgi:hypothetical protein